MLCKTTFNKVMEQKKPFISTYVEKNNYLILSYSVHISNTAYAQDSLLSMKIKFVLS